MGYVIDNPQLEIDREELPSFFHLMHVTGRQVEALSSLPQNSPNVYLQCAACGAVHSELAPKINQCRTCRKPLLSPLFHTLARDGHPVPRDSAPPPISTLIARGLHRIAADLETSMGPSRERYQAWKSMLALQSDLHALVSRGEFLSGVDAYDPKPAHKHALELFFSHVKGTQSLWRASKEFTPDMLDSGPLPLRAGLPFPTFRGVGASGVRKEDRWNLPTATRFTRRILQDYEFAKTIVGDFPWYSIFYREALGTYGSYRGAHVAFFNVTPTLSSPYWITVKGERVPVMLSKPDFCNVLTVQAS